MTRRSPQMVWFFVVLWTFAVMAAACGSDSDGGSGSDGSDDSGGGGSEGSVFVSGSSTVEPISVKVAELFEDVEPGVTVDVEGPGTGDGFKKFCAGESDVSDASRQIKDEEAADCEAAGITFTELKVGIDGIAVMTSPANEAVDLERRGGSSCSGKLGCFARALHAVRRSPCPRSAPTDEPAR